MSTAVNYMHLPKTCWYVFASQGEAAIFRGPRAAPEEFVLRLKNKRARRKEQELSLDRPGRVQSGGSARHALGKDHVHHDHFTESFAAGIASELERASADRKYDELVLVAEPSFLGVLRERLSEQVARKVIEEVPKEITAVSTQEARDRISDWRKKI